MPRPPFIADVVALRRRHGHREPLKVVAPLAGMFVTGSRVPDTDPVTLDVNLEAVEGGVVVNGMVAAPFVGECRRCLGPVIGTIESPVDEIFVKDPEEGETYPILGDHIDLEPLAREAIVLALPLAPLCRPDCAGLCPECGVDRNAGPCGCESPAVDERWAALDVLRSPSAGAEDHQH